MGNNFYKFGPVAITGSAGWVQIGILLLGGNRAGVDLNIQNSGAAAFTEFKLSKCAVSGGTHVDWIGANSSDWSTFPVGEILSVCPAALYQLAAGAFAEIHIGNVKGIQEIGVWAQAASDTQATVVGTASS